VKKLQVFDWIGAVVVIMGL